MDYDILPAGDNYLSLIWTRVLQPDTGERKDGKGGRGILNPFPVAKGEFAQDG